MQYIVCFNTCLIDNRGVIVWSEAPRGVRSVRIFTKCLRRIFEELRHVVLLHFYSPCQRSRAGNVLMLREGRFGSFLLLFGYEGWGFRLRFSINLYRNQIKIYFTISKFFHELKYENILHHLASCLSCFKSDGRFSHVFRRVWRPWRTVGDQCAFPGNLL